MSDSDRQSPRAAIRNWLQATDSKLNAKPTDALPKGQDIERPSRHHVRRHHTKRHRSETKDQHAEEAGRKRPRHDNSGLNSRQAQTRLHSQENTAEKSEGLGLAERLGLHAPFRTFKDHSDNSIPDVGGRPPKRRRIRSSTSSYLEPAATNDLSDNCHDRLDYSAILRTANERPALGDRGKNTSSTASQGSETLLPSPEKLLKSFERRPRHKTRQDRYELKDSHRDSVKTLKTAKKDRGEKPQKKHKHKRKEKSGAALMHDFAAQNVAHDRLTVSCTKSSFISRMLGADTGPKLKPAKTLGLFGKGRASSPVRRRGCRFSQFLRRSFILTKALQVPDLAFSEMTFLTSRREKPENSFADSSKRPSDTTKKRKSAKAADTEAQISRYFMSAKPASPDVTTSHGQRIEQDRRKSRDRQSPQFSVDLPERSFLGFGSCGPNTSISPAKTLANTNSGSLRRRDPRSPTRSTSYFTWSPSEGPSYASPPPNRRYHVEPTKSSRLSNRKRTSPADLQVQHPTKLVSPTCIQTKSLGTQDATSGSSSKPGNANEAPGEKKGSQSATDKRIKSMEKSQTYDNTGIIELDSAKTALVIEESGPDSTHPADAATYNDPGSAPLPRTHAVCQSSGHEPRREPQSHDGRSLSAHIPIISQQNDPLDDILEALLKACNSSLAGSGSASRAISSHGNVHVGEEARILDRIQEHTRIPTHDSIDNVHEVEAQISTSKTSKKPRSASLQEASALEGPRSTHTPSTGSLIYPNRSNLGYFQGCPELPRQSQVDSRNAWNDYDNIYQRQQEQAQDSGDHIPFYTAVRDDLSGPSRVTNPAIAPDEYAQIFHPLESGDDFDCYRPYSYKTLREWDENGKYQEITHGECHDQSIYNWTPQLSDASVFDESRKDCDHGIMAESNVDDYQEREIDADHEQSIAQGANQHEVGHQLFTTNTPEAQFALRPRNIFNRDYSLKKCPTDVLHDVEPALSGFWTPHKLY